MFIFSKFVFTLLLRPTSPIQPWQIATRKVLRKCHHLKIWRRNHPFGSSQQVSMLSMYIMNTASCDSHSLEAVVDILFQIPEIKRTVLPNIMMATAWNITCYSNGWHHQGRFWQRPQILINHDILARLRSSAYLGTPSQNNLAYTICFYFSMSTLYVCTTIMVSRRRKCWIP